MRGQARSLESNVLTRSRELLSHREPIGPHEEGSRGRRPKLVYILSAPQCVPAFLAGQLSFLRQAGFAVTVVAPAGKELFRCAASEGVAAVPVMIERRIAVVKDLVALWNLWRLLRRLKPDVTNVGTPKAGLLGGLAAWLARVPCRVYTLHGLRLETTAGRLRKVLTVSERLACRLAHQVICVSPSLRRKVLALKLAEPARVIVLGSGSANGLDTAFFDCSLEAQGETALRKRLKIPDSAAVIGFVGRLARDKGIDELVGAFQKLRRQFPAARLLLVGDFEKSDPPEPATRKAIEQDPRIVATGHVDNPAPYYRLMNVLALPTRREGFPTVALEAAAAGKPVVTTRVTGAEDAVLDGQTGLLVPQRNAAALAAALERMLAQPETAAAMGRCGRGWVEREFASLRLWRELRDVYVGLLGNASRATTARASQPCRAPVDSSGLRRRRRVKWAFDVIVAGCSLVLLAPFLIVIALAVVATMGRPVLFRQTRVGCRGQNFDLIKFRTMTEERDSLGRLLPDSQRLTRLGRLLRRSSVDEIPQFWNVLRGDMSLVGPRPLLCRYLPYYTEAELGRHQVPPGITGWAQIHGRNRLGWDERLARDAWYAENWSLALDVKILVHTLGKVLRARDVDEIPSESMNDLDVERTNVIGGAA